jgi:hypothetical protein
MPPMRLSLRRKRFIMLYRAAHAVQEACPYISYPRAASPHLYVQPIGRLITSSVLQPPYYRR